MKGFGLDYDALAAIKPDLVMVSACLNGQTGPHKDYPGFGGQGSALVGLQLRSPAGPTASPSARTARSPTRSRRASSRPRSPPGCSTGAAPAAACTSTSSQVEAAIYQPGAVAARLRRRRRHPPARRQPARRRGAARRVPVRRRGRRRRPVGRDRVPRRRRLGRRSRASSASTTRRSPRVAARTAREDDVEALVRRGRRTGPAPRSRRSCRRPGIEAVPVEDFGDLHDDPQLAAPRSLRAAHAPVPRRRPLRAQRLPALRRGTGYDRAGPTLGQDNDWVLGDLLGLDADAIAALRASGAVE